MMSTGQSAREYALMANVLYVGTTLLAVLYTLSGTDRGACIRTQTAKMALTFTPAVGTGSPRVSFAGVDAMQESRVNNKD